MITLTMTSFLGADFSTVILPKALYVFIGLVIGQLIDNFFSQPFIFSTSVKSHPLEIFLVIIIAGLFLMLKKDIGWIQPPTQRSTVEVTGAPETSLIELYEAASAIPELQITAWDQFERIDIRSDRGIAKFIAPNRWEAQVDLVTLEVLSLEYRRSDLIEQIHDGSFFADWVKTFIFLPIGVVLLVLWLTGIWMFFNPYIKRWKRKKRLSRRATSNVSDS